MASRPSPSGGSDGPTATRSEAENSPGPEPAAEDVPLTATELALLVEAAVSQEGDYDMAVEWPGDIEGRDKTTASEPLDARQATGSSREELDDLLERFGQTHPYNVVVSDAATPATALGHNRRPSASSSQRAPTAPQLASPAVTPSPVSPASTPLLPPTYSVDSSAAKLITELRRIYLSHVVKDLPPGAAADAVPPPSSSSLSSANLVLPTSAPASMRHTRTNSLSGRPELTKVATSPAELGSKAVASSSSSRSGSSPAPAKKSFVARMTLPAVTVEPFEQSQPLLRFVGFLKRVRGMYPPELFVADWWTSVLYPILMNSRWKDLTDISVGVVHEMVVGEVVDSHFPNLILDAYIAEADRAMELFGQKDAEGRWDAVGWSVGAMNLEKVLRDVAFAKPKDFFTSLNGFFVDPATRIRATRVLSKILKRDDIAAHVIVETPLLDSILSSLMVDTYPALVTIELSILIFLMPRIPTSLPALLPRLFKILVRVLLWESALARELDERSKAATTLEIKAGTAYAQKSVHRCADMYFTHLYGMWPCSLVDFLRDFMAGNGDLKEEPGVASGGRFADLLRSVLGDRGVDTSKRVPVQKIDNMAELVGEFETVDWSLRKVILEKSLADYFRRYTLHPSLFQLTAAAELVQNPERWSQMSDPSEIVAECLERRHRTAVMLGDEVTGTDDGYRDFLGSDGIGSSSLANGSRGDALAEDSSTGAIPGTALTPAHVTGPSGQDGLDEISAAVRGPVPVPSAVNLEDVLGQYEVLRGIADEKQIIKGDLDQSAQLDQTIPRSVILQLLLLLNELNLELYFRQIHLSWIRRLRKFGRNDEVIHAEREALLVKLQASANEVKAMEKKLISERITVKEERDGYNAVIAGLNTTIADLHKSLAEQGLKERVALDGTQEAFRNADQLKGRLEDANTRIFELETRLSVLEPRSVQLKERDIQVTHLTKQLVMWEYDTRAGRAMAQRVRELEGELVNLKLVISGKDKELADKDDAFDESRALAASVTVKLQNSEKRLEKSDLLLKDLNASLTKLRMVENEKLKVLEEKYQTIRGINLQLQNRIGALYAQMEQVKSTSTTSLSPGTHSPISKSQSEILAGSRAPSPLATPKPLTRTNSNSPSAPSSPATTGAPPAIRGSTQLPALPDERKPGRTPSSGSGGGQTSQLSAGLARYNSTNSGGSAKSE